MEHSIVRRAIADAISVYQEWHLCISGRERQFRSFAKYFNEQRGREQQNILSFCAAVPATVHHSGDKE